MKPIMFAAAAGLVIAGSASASTSSTHYAGHQLAAHAKVTLDQARAAALRARPGRIVDQELEREGGGSGLRYSFDIVSKAKTVEVGIDAMTGAILENGAESPAKEAKERLLEAGARG